MPHLLRIAAGLSAAVALAGHASADQTVAARGAPAAGVASSRAVACLAEAIYFEARGTGDAGRAAVAQVVLNRARSAEFPDTVCGVVGDGCQFSYRCDGEADQLANPAARANALRTAEAVLTGAPDITNGALFFHSASADPGWFSTRPRVGEIGGNVFYR
jgi:spore germination cell wall hydrolase CwlJ-like protein